MRRVRFALVLVGLVVVCYLGLVVVFPNAGDPIGLELGHELQPTTKRFGESLVLLAFAVGLGFFMWSLGKEIRKYWLMNLRGITVPGTVRTVDIVDRGSEEEPDYFARVDLVLTDGRATNLLVKGHSFDKLAVGRPVKVRYDPKGYVQPRFTNWRPGNVLLSLFVSGWVHYLFLGGVLASVGLAVAAIVHMFTGN